ncbi:MAG: MBL fold metallo-hydrolase [Polyangiaceae bacterium]|nr:MBL fold metallo-hydrolase [Polyangiaceae bacterium]
MEIQFLGAAQTVTGSMHLVRTKHATVLLDCGMFQGRRHESFERNKHLAAPVKELSAVVVSHAHIDHSGAIPMLAKNGYTRPIYATPATRDLCAVMLRDAAAIQASDARYLNRHNDREGIDADPIEPLYEDDDVVEALSHFVSVPYKTTIPIAHGVELTFIDAGHVLGSAITILDVEEDGKKRRVVFTGDLGRANRPILRDPEVAEGADVLITESTYGDRNHDGMEKMEEDLANVVNRVMKRGGKLLVPSFALERAQEVIFYLKKLSAKGKIPHVPIYVDSPLTVKITDIFKLHPECFDTETRALLRGGDSPFELSDLKYIEDVEASKAVSSRNDPCIVISASGMCEAGRILHHLRSSIEDDNSAVLIVGFQAQHTLGRRLVEKRDRVKIFGVERNRRAEVVVLNGFSAHADQRDLLSYADACKKTGKVSQIALVHGEPRPQKILRELLLDRAHEEVFIPETGQKLEIR